MPNTGHLRLFDSTFNSFQVQKTQFSLYVRTDMYVLNCLQEAHKINKHQYSAVRVLVCSRIDISLPEQLFNHLQGMVVTFSKLSLHHETAVSFLRGTIRFNRSITSTFECQFEYLRLNTYVSDLSWDHQHDTFDNAVAQHV